MRANKLRLETEIYHIATRKIANIYQAENDLSSLYFYFTIITFTIFAISSLYIVVVVVKREGGAPGY